MPEVSCPNSMWLLRHFILHRCMPVFERVARRACSSRFFRAQTSKVLLWRLAGAVTLQRWLGLRTQRAAYALVVAACLLGTAAFYASVILVWA